MWGYNLWGQLGDGTLTSRNRPLTTLSRIYSIAAAGDDTYVVRTDGSVWSIGNNNRGALGDGTTTSRRSAVRVAGMSQALSVSGGLNFGLAVGADGAAMAWGDNSYYKLGSGSAGDRHSPVPIAGLSLVSNSWLLQDTDGDLLTNAGEYRRDLDPLNPDSNSDELLDSVTGDNPPGGVNLDRDGDGISSAMEAIKGTDPLQADTDGDGAMDGADCYPLDPTQTQCTSDPNDHTPPTITLLEPVNATLVP